MQLISPEKIDPNTNTEKLNDIEPKDLTLSTWPRDKFRDFSYSYQNALRLFFKMKKSRLPEEQRREQLKKPEGFVDPVNLPLKPIKYTEATRSQNFNWYIVNNAVLTYNQDSELNSGTKITINDESEESAHDQRVDQISKLEKDTQQSIIIEGFKKTVKDISSLAAMIKVETSNVSEHSPFGAAAVTFHRVDSESWGNNFYEVLSGPPQPGKPGSSWNNSKSYSEHFKCR